MADLQQLEEQIVGLSLLDAAQLVKKLEERLGVSAAAAAPVMMAGGGAAGGAAPAGEENQVHGIFKGGGGKKIKLIQAGRGSTHPGFKGNKGPGGGAPKTGEKGG